MDFRLELVAVPVSDVDRAKAFYVDRAGFNADHDHVINENLRFVQLTPPGSACSIAIGTGVTDAQPGSVRGLQLVVSDIEAARAELAGRGVEVSEIERFPWGAFVFLRPGRQRLGRAADLPGRSEATGAPAASDRHTVVVVMPPPRASPSERARARPSAARPAPCRPWPRRQGRPRPAPPLRRGARGGSRPRTRPHARVARADP